jgi:hypothetical protein
MATAKRFSSTGYCVISAHLQDVGRIFDSQRGKGFVLQVLEWRLTSHIILISQYILCLRLLQGFSNRPLDHVPQNV